jgi:hypothetical protein
MINTGRSKVSQSLLIREKFRWFNRRLTRHNNVTAGIAIVITLQPNHR